MDKRYQVFVSSTYTDLLDARAEVMQALLELDCMPAGMELFPAANEEQWKWIQKVIRESDYYVVIVGGRYGSIAKQSGLSYTEMEYRYALEIGKPVIGFLHENPSMLLAKFCEASEDGRVKLDAFRTLVQQKLCKMWNAPADLGAKVSRSITQLIKQHPTVGWVRANELTEETSKELLGLRKQVEDLQGKLRQMSTEGPPGLENLARGDEQFAIAFVVDRKTARQGKRGQTYWAKTAEERDGIIATWDEIFAHLAPDLITSLPESSCAHRINQLVAWRATRPLEKKFSDSRFENFQVYTEDFQTIKIQLRALGLIAIKGADYTTRWELTEYGDAYMARLLAVKRRRIVGKRK